MKILFLSGVSGVGKTTYAHKLKDHLSQWIEARILESPIRKVSKEKGFTTEQQILDLEPKEFFNIQQSFLTALAEGIQDYLDKPFHGLLISERHPFDHVSYFISNYKGDETAIDYQLKHQALTLLSSIESKYCVGSFTVDFPFPIPWNTKDYYRANPYTKNMAWDIVRRSLFSTKPQTLTDQNILPEERVHHSLYTVTESEGLTLREWLRT